MKPWVMDDRLPALIQRIYDGKSRPADGPTLNEIINDYEAKINRLTLEVEELRLTREG